MLISTVYSFMNEDEDIVILRTYNKIWKFERKLYSFEGLKLLFPISINQALYFAISIGISIFFIKVIPFYSRLHFVIKMVVVPYLIMKFLTKQKLDGKLPHKFFLDYVMYKLSPKKYERFSPIDEYKTVKFATPIPYRESMYINKTERAIRESNKKQRKWKK